MWRMNESASISNASCVPVLDPARQQQVAREARVVGLGRRERREVVLAGQQRGARVQQVAVQAARPEQRPPRLERRPLATGEHAVAVRAAERVPARVKALRSLHTRPHRHIGRQQRVQRLSTQRRPLIRGDLPRRMNPTVRPPRNRQRDLPPKDPPKRRLDLRLNRPLTGLTSPAIELRAVVFEIQASGHERSPGSHTGHCGLRRPTGRGMIEAMARMHGRRAAGTPRPAGPRRLPARRRRSRPGRPPPPSPASCGSTPTPTESATGARRPPVVCGSRSSGEAARGSHACEPPRAPPRGRWTLRATTAGQLPRPRDPPVVGGGLLPARKGRDRNADSDVAAAGASRGRSAIRVVPARGSVRIDAGLLPKRGRSVARRRPSRAGSRSRRPSSRPRRATAPARLRRPCVARHRQ